MDGILKHITWLLVVSVSASLLPMAAALRARVPLRTDPAGQVGLAWLVLGGCSVLQTVSAPFGARVMFWETALTIVLLPLVLLPPFLTWIGERAKRLQPALFACTVGAGALGLAAIGPGRPFQIVAHPLMSALMAIVVLLAMRAQAVRHAALEWDADPLRRGWPWISGGHLVYFLSSVLWFPLMETLVPRDWNAVVSVNRAMMLLHATTMVAIAHGIARHGVHAAATARAPMATAA